MGCILNWDEDEPLGSLIPAKNKQTKHYPRIHYINTGRGKKKWESQLEGHLQIVA